MNSALYPVIEHLQRLLHMHREDTPEERLEKLEHILHDYRFAQDEVIPLFAALLSVPLPDRRYPPLHLSLQQQKRKTAEALVAWLVEAAERQPLLAVWEDLHWADPSTLELLSLIILSFRQASLTSLLESVTSALQGIIRRFDLDAGGVRRVATPQTAQTPPSSQAQPRRGLGAT